MGRVGRRRMKGAGYGVGGRVDRRRIKGAWYGFGVG